MLPEDEVPSNMRPQFSSDLGGGGGGGGLCCSTGSRGKIQAMMETDAGDYIVETRYRHVGMGRGKFSLVDIEQGDKDEEDGTPCWCLWVPVVAVVLVGFLVFGWLFMPGDSWGAKSQSTSSNEADLKTYIQMDMELGAVKWETFWEESEANVRERFITEIKEGVAIKVARGLRPNEVLVDLVEGRDDAIAWFEPPQSRTTNVEKLASQLQDDANEIADGIAQSLEMTTGIDYVRGGPMITVSNLRVSVVEKGAADLAEAKL